VNYFRLIQCTEFFSRSRLREANIVVVIWPDMSGLEYDYKIQESAVQNFHNGDFTFDVLFNDVI
jgi:hypothetical protein